MLAGRRSSGWLVSVLGVLAGVGLGCGDSTSSPAPDGGPAGADSGADGGARGDASGLPFRMPPVAGCRAGDVPPPAVRLVSWNVAVGRVSSIAQIGEELANLDPDIVLVQELDLGTRRSNGQDQPALLAQSLGMQYTFVATFPWDGGFFGMGIFSRLPFAEVDVRWLDPTGAAEPRVGLNVVLCLGARRLRVAGYHGDHISRDAAARNASELVTWLKANGGDAGTVLAGDFNAELAEGGPQSALAAGMVDLLAEHDPGPTFGNRRLDFAFGSPDVARTVSSARRVESTASDHLPLLVDFQIGSR